MPLQEGPSLVSPLDDLRVQARIARGVGGHARSDGVGGRPVKARDRPVRQPGNKSTAPPLRRVRYAETVAGSLLSIARISSIISRESRLTVTIRRSRSTT